jgi:nitroreductase
MDLIEGLLTRRSVRRFIDKKIEKEVLGEIIRVAQYSASAHNTKPWEFLVVEDKEDLGKFRSLQRSASFASNAAAVILVCVDETKTLTREKEGWSYADIDGSSATTTLLLAAHANGVGACWCGCAPMTKPLEDVKEYFKLPEHIRPFSIVVLGYPEHKPRQPDDREDKSKIHWGSWE